MRLQTLTALGLTAGLTAFGCAQSSPADLDGTTGVVYVGDGGGPGSGNDGAGGSASSGGNKTPAHTALDDRKTDYGEAYRTATLKLTGVLPKLADVKALDKASDKKTAYGKAIDRLFADNRFQERMIKWWKDTFRLGDDAGQPNGMPSRDTAPTLAARIIVEEQPFTDLVTQDSNTCPTYDMQNHKFVDGDCNNGVTKHAGVLTNPGAMYQFFSHMAFRRVRWVQEIFVCTKFPAEFANKPTKVHGADYTSPWPFGSIASAPIDFQDTSSVVCANCHTSINHIAPLFGNFDDKGQLQGSVQVQTPVAPTATTTKMTDWLPAGESTHWRMDDAAADLPALGAAMAGDPDVADCAVTRAYNFAFSKGDVVSDLATVPDEVLNDYRANFLNNGMNLKATLKKMFKSEDFTKY